MSPAHLIIYALSFVLIWLGSGLIISSVDKFAKKLHLSSFALSFILLGLLTSTPELALSLTALSQNNPEIFIGNLIGGIPVLFFFVIPLFSLLGNGIMLKNDFDHKTFLITLGVVIAPSLFVLDKHVTSIESVTLILIYLLLVFIIQRKHGLFDEKHTEILNGKSYSYIDLIKTLTGVVLVFFASQIIVEKTLYFSNYFKLSQFFISLVILSLGTNLPEISLAIRSVVLKKKDIAFGDYMGSAAANTLFFGIFTLLSKKEVFTVNTIQVTFIFLLSGLTLFYIFARSKNFISRKEALALLILYILFVTTELLI